MPGTGLVIGGVPCTIALDDAGDSAVVESITPEGPRAVVVFKCKHSDRYTLFRALLGTTVANGRAIVRIPPFGYPDSPNLRCTSIGDTRGIKPRVDVRGWVVYDQVLFAATFEIPKYQYEEAAPGGQNDPSGKPWTTTKFSVAANVVAPPDGGFYIGPFPGGKKLDDAAVGFIQPDVEISITRHFVPYVPLDEVMQSIGSTNATTVTFANRIFTPGTLLFAGMENDPQNDAAGNSYQEISYKLLGKSTDWNRFLARDGTMQLLNTKDDGTGKPPYAKSDFYNQLP